MKSINSISVNDILWVRFEKYQINFRFGNVPSDIHFTIAFNDRNLDVNLHITRNVGDPNNKPKIEIARISKKILTEDVSLISKILIGSIVETIDIDKLIKENSDAIVFFPYDTFEQEDIKSLVEQNLLEVFDGKWRIKEKSKLKIETDIGDSIEAFSKSHKINEIIFDNLFELDGLYDKPIEAGSIITNQDEISVIRIDDNWFKFKEDIEIIDILTAFVGKDIADYLVFYTKKSIEVIKSAMSWEDTKVYNRPIILERRLHI